MTFGPPFPAITAPIPPPPPPTLLARLALAVESPAVKAFVPVVVIAAIAPAVYWMFHATWRELDEDAQRERAAMLARGEVDMRPALVCVVAAMVLTLQEYYGGRGTFDELIRPVLARWEAAGKLPKALALSRWDELYGYAWWSATRVAGYVVVPFAAYKLAYPRESLLDMGLRVRGLRQHLWIYALCLAAVVPAMLFVSRAPDFGNYYPFYKLSSRSWLDLALWEAMYFAQFFALEVFFRGFWLVGLRRSLGSGAIFAMCVPYCMIHFGKPFLEANGAIIAGVVLGSLSMRTRSIYSGFLVHITVALSMDLLALSHRHALPVRWLPPV